MISEIEGLAVPALLGLASAGALTGLVELARHPARDKTDRWRDPAPRLFRLLLPTARQIALWLTLSAQQQGRLQQRLDCAGVGYAILPSELIALRALTGLGAMLMAASVLLLLAGAPLKTVSVSIIAAFLGAAYPDLWLFEQRKRRQRSIERHFPGLLELLALTVRAGMGFGTALAQTGEHLPNGPLKVECQRLNREIRTGFSRQDALAGLAARTQLRCVKSFVGAVIQADETGAAISPVLADQARQGRRERFAAAEKKANEAPVRMLLPLVALLFPVTFLIIGFPIALQFMDSGL